MQKKNFFKCFHHHTQTIKNRMSLGQKSSPKKWPRASAVKWLMVTSSPGSRAKADTKVISSSWRFRIAARDVPCNEKLVGGFNPVEKYARQNGNLPQFSGWKWQIFELPPPRNWMLQDGYTTYTPTALVTKKNWDVSNSAADIGPGL